MLELIAFDLMDTVVVDPFYQALPRAFGLTFEELIAAKEPAVWEDFERGQINEREFLARFFRPGSARAAPDPAWMRDVLGRAYCFVEGIEPLLGELRRAEVRCWVLSNYSRWIDLAWAELELQRFFEGCVASCDTGLRKPEAGAYAALCRRAAVAPAEVLLVDDQQANVDGAVAAGMRAARFVGVDSLREALAELGVLASSPGRRTTTGARPR